jgi:hypothetical protein
MFHKFTLMHTHSHTHTHTHTQSELQTLSNDHQTQLTHVYSLLEKEKSQFEAHKAGKCMVV